MNKKLKMKMIKEDYIPILLLDNESSMNLAENPEYHKRTKHIDIQYYFIRECIENKKLNIGHVPSREQLADWLTKGVDNNKHKFFIECTNIKSI